MPTLPFTRRVMPLSRPSSALIVDGNNLLMRAVKAMERVGLSSDGVATGPFMSFATSLAMYVRAYRPRVVVVCWDGGRSEYRTSLLPEYKANRRTPDAAAEEFKESSFALTKEFLALAGVPTATVPGFEADDLIARYWRMTWLSPMRIVSGDKDLLQLITPEVTVVRPQPGAYEEWNEDRMIDKYGCPARYWSDVLALAGDTADGIQGVPRVGVKTAVKDLSKEGWSLERLIESGHPRYAPHVKRIRLNQQLVDLRNGGCFAEVGNPHLFEPTHPGAPGWEALVAFLDHYELDGIRSKMAAGLFWT